MTEQQQQQTFPFKLYEMLEYACDSEFSSSLSWSADGSVFIISDKDVLMDVLAPKFFKQTQFRSFTRQLNIWGFVRTDTLGGEKGGWQHKDFIRERPDLLNRIDRVEVKSAVMKKKKKKTISSIIKSKTLSDSSQSARSVAEKTSFSITKSKTSSGSSQSAKSAAARSAHIAVFADESNYCSSSPLDTQASYAVDSALPVAVPPMFPASQGSVFQYFYIPSPSNLQDSASSSIQAHGNAANATEQESMYNYAEDTTSIAQPFGENELMYLARIFDREEQHHSHYEELSSIFSLNHETTEEDFLPSL